jgi:hypothetical protein
MGLTSYATDAAAGLSPWAVVLYNVHSLAPEDVSDA